MRKLIFNISISLAAVTALFGVSACNNYLDVVPDDGIATIDMAFNLRSSAIRYLATCYSYMTEEGNPDQDPGMLAGDEMWDLKGRAVSNRTDRVSGTLFNIARGLMSANSVYGNNWASMYQGIRCCDILCENINNVPDMQEWEKKQWAAEAKFLKAYYHFTLIRKFGPVPIIHESLPIDSDIETVRVYRDPIDSCFNFVINLLDEAMPNLPLVNQSNDELGRATRSMCAALKAKVAVYAASPLFNGNAEEATLVDARGVQLFPSKSDAEKQARWDAAMIACKEALEICKQNYELYQGKDLIFDMVDTLKREMILRNAYNERWNTEVIWGNTQTNSTAILAFQQWTMPKFQTDILHNTAGYQFIGVPLKIAEEFYTDKGLPIANDKSWSGVNPLELKVGDADHKYYLEEGYTTIRMNFNREPRYYAFLGFDGGKWMGAIPSGYNNLTPDKLNVIKCRMGGANAKSGPETGPVTGIYPKKLYPYQCIITGQNSMTTYWYPTPVIRLTDLYLLYAEAINEAEGPTGAHKEDMYACLDTIRSRAGIPDVRTAWDQYSNNPGYYNTKVGMRSIIHRERLNELAFESNRFWDLRRWKEASAEYNKFIYGFKLTGSSPEDYYVKTLVSEQPFGLKDYFWPIHTSYIETNPNLVQNIGW